MVMREGHATDAEKAGGIAEDREAEGEEKRRRARQKGRQRDRETE